jgi:hypothetical protein
LEKEGRSVRKVLESGFCLVMIVMSVVAEVLVEIAARRGGVLLGFVVWAGIAACVGMLNHVFERWALRRLLRAVRKVVERFAPSDRGVGDEAPCDDESRLYGAVALEGAVLAKRKMLSPAMRKRCVAYRCRVWSLGSDEEPTLPRLLLERSRATPFRVAGDAGTVDVVPGSPWLVATRKGRVTRRIRGRVRRLLNKRGGAAGMNVRIREDYILEGDRVVVMGRCSRPGPTATGPYRTRRRQLEPAADFDGVGLAVGTHAELLERLDTRQLDDEALPALQRGELAP